MPRYLGDFNPGSVVDFKFLTTSDGKTQTTLAGTPRVRVYKDSSTTEETTVYTPTVDFDSLTGLNHVSIDTSADATFFTSGSTYEAVVQAGTVGGTSIVGAVLATFSIHHRGPRRTSLYFRTRKYGVALGTGNNKKIRFQVNKANGAGFAVAADWTPATGDMKLSKDGGAQANVTTLPSYTNGAWELELSQTEMQAEQLDISIVDAAPKAIEDCQIVIETYGNASAMYIDDASTAGASLGADGGVILSGSQPLV